MTQLLPCKISRVLFCAFIAVAQISLVRAAPGAPVRSCEQTPACKTANAEAIALFEGHHYQEALRKFQLAYSIVASDNLLLSIGRVLFRLDDYAGSIEYLTRFSATAQARDRENKRKLDKYLTEAQACLGKCTQLRDRGLKALEERRFVDALPELEAAHGLQPDAALLIGQGRALHGLGRYSQASERYRQALAILAQGEPRQQSEVAQLLKESEAASAVPIETPATDLPCAPYTPCAGLVVQSPPAAVMPAPPPGGVIDHDLDGWQQPKGESKPIYKSAALWVGVSLGAAAVIAGIVGGVYAAKSSASGNYAPIYSVSWK